LTCPRCGAPLPQPTWDGFATCAYCGVRTEIYRPVETPPPTVPFAYDDTPSAQPPRWSGEDVPDHRPHSLVAAAVAFVVIFGLLVAYAALQPQSSGSGTGAPVAHCSVVINASASSGPAPFTGTFSADISTPPGDSAGDPMWQFGPFPPGFDLNYTYGTTVTHTWDTNGTYGVHVTVPDSSLQGCWTATTITVT
jgi:hypothetical protein